MRRAGFWFEEMRDISEQAFAGSGWRVVMSVGRYVDPAALGALPEGVAVHRWVPQLVVLAEATVFLSHAGMGSAVRALWSGVPVLAVQQVFDQPVIAERLVELGVGRHLHREDVTPAVMREAVESLTARDGASEPERAVGIVEQVAAALDTAHEHRAGWERTFGSNDPEAPCPLEAP